MPRRRKESKTGGITWTVTKPDGTEIRAYSGKDGIRFIGCTQEEFYDAVIASMKDRGTYDGFLEMLVAIVTNKNR